MKLVLLSLFSLLLKTSSFCQYIGDYRPLSFDQLDPLWIHVSMDSTIVGYPIEDPRDPLIGFDGYSHVYPNTDITHHLLTYDGFLYRISRTLYDVDISGALLEKIDMETGKNSWTQHFDLRTSLYREFLKKAFIADNKLILYTYRVTTPDMEFPFPIVLFGKAEGLLMIREYDLETGELLQFIENTEITHETKFLATDLDMRVQLNTIDPQTIEVRHHFLKDSRGAYILVDTINTNGLILNPVDTLFSTHTNVNWNQSYWSSDHVMTKDRNGRFYWIDYYSPGGTSTDSPQAQLTIEDNTGIVTIPLMEYNPDGIVKNWEIVDVTDSLILINTIRHDTTNDFIILTLSGQLRQWIHSEKERHNALPVLDENGQFILAEYDGIQNGKHQLAFYQPVDNHLELLSMFSISDPDYLVLPVSMDKLQNGNYLLYVMHTKANNQGVVEGRFMTDILLTPEMIGLKTSATDPNISSLPSFIISPNPATSYIRVDFENPVTGELAVFDNVGRLVLHHSIHASQSMDLDVCDFPSGFYAIQFQDRDDSIKGICKSFFKL
jgi:hypothetical protein